MENITISGYVNFESAKLPLVRVLTNKFENVGIKEGYLSITYSKVSDTQMELAIFGDGWIEDSTSYRDTLFNLSKLIDSESSILLKEDPNESWTSTTTLKSRESTFVAQTIHVPNKVVTKVPS